MCDTDIDKDLEIQEQIIAETIEQEYYLSHEDDSNDLPEVVDVDPSQMSWEDYVKVKQDQRRKQKESLERRRILQTTNMERLKRNGIGLMVQKLNGLLASANIPDLKESAYAAYKFAVDATSELAEKIRQSEINLWCDEHKYECTAGRFDDI